MIHTKGNLNVNENSETAIYPTSSPTFTCSPRLPVQRSH